MNSNNLTPLRPAHGGSPEQINFEDKSNPEKLRHLVRELKTTMGQHYDPVVRIAELAEECIEKGDLKTAIQGLDLVASRMYPKLKAMEISDEREKVIFINTGPADGGADGADDIEDASIVT